MKTTILIILSVLIICFTGDYANGCLQPAGRYQVGKRIDIENVSVQDFAKNLVSHEDRTYWEKVKSDLERENKNRPFQDNRNNLAVALIHLGQVKDGIALLEELERKSPGQYVIAANLGTAYELNGENQKALDWIKESVNRNKDSHFGTEWLHVKILEAKLAKEKESDWLNRHSVLGIDFGSSDTPQQPNKLTTDYFGREKSLPEIETALVYQLHERLEFTKTPDPIVAELLFDLSNVFALLRTNEHRKIAYDLALNYGANPTEIVKKRQPIKNTVNTASRSNYNIFYAILAAVILAVIFSFFIVIKKRKLH